MKKLLVSLIIFFWLAQTYALDYVLNQKDLILVDSIQKKILSIVDEENIESTIVTLQKYTKNSKNIRVNKILEAVIDNLNVHKNTVVILEWWNIYDIDNYLYSKKLIQKWEYIKYVEDKNKIIALSNFFEFLDNQETLEWYLYPDTYYINSSNFKINEFVIQQLEAFEKKVYIQLFIDENWNKKYINDVTHSVINLASIVEKEEKNILEKPVVAWILKKRVKEYWNIWADITTCYPYKFTSKQCSLEISKYINEKSDYNTRFIIWLPPTPISNPSFETIYATLYSQDTNYNYYLHDINTWKIYYAETNTQHNKNKQLYIKNKK